MKTEVSGDKTLICVFHIRQEVKFTHVTVVTSQQINIQNTEVGVMFSEIGKM